MPDLQGDAQSPKAPAKPHGLIPNRRPAALPAAPEDAPPVWKMPLRVAPVLDTVPAPPPRVRVAKVKTNFAFGEPYPEDERTSKGQSPRHRDVLRIIEAKVAEHYHHPLGTPSCQSVARLFVPVFERVAKDHGFWYGSANWRHRKGGNWDRLVKLFVPALDAAIKADIPDENPDPFADAKDW